MGTLFLVATPIGNIEDITIRSLKKILSAEFLVCEDTRRTGQLIRFLQGMCHENGLTFPVINPHQVLLSFYEQNEHERIPQIIAFLKNDKDVVLVSDAGTPAVSDPGFRIVRACVEEGIAVESLPGASSVLTALTTSGLPTDKFLFVGYPPLKPGHRITFFQHIKTLSETMSTTIIMFESPHKLPRTLGDMQEVLGDIDIVLCRELTKKFEQVRREKLSVLATHYRKHHPKGEFVILFHL